MPAARRFNSALFPVAGTSARQGNATVPGHAAPRRAGSKQKPLHRRPLVPGALSSLTGHHSPLTLTTIKITTKTHEKLRAPGPFPSTRHGRNVARQSAPRSPALPPLQLHPRVVASAPRVTRNSLACWLLVVFSFKISFSKLHYLFITSNLFSHACNIKCR